MSQIYQRKRDHIALSHRGPVGLDGDQGLWGDVQLVHQALPERRLSEIFLKRPLHLLRFPVLQPLLSRNICLEIEIYFN